jgi:hypothetical protein
MPWLSVDQIAGKAGRTSREERSPAQSADDRLCAPRLPSIEGDVAIAAGMTFLLHGSESMDPLVRTEALAQRRSPAGGIDSGFG